jgi:hypothetical protein
LIKIIHKNEIIFYIQYSRYFYYWQCSFH